MCTYCWPTSIGEISISFSMAFLTFYAQSRINFCATFYCILFNSEHLPSRAFVSHKYKYTYIYVHRNSEFLWFLFRTENMLLAQFSYHQQQRYALYSTMSFVAATTERPHTATMRCIIFHWPTWIFNIQNKARRKCENCCP